MLNIAADHDPRIAESFEAWHGSPHDFDRFDSSQDRHGRGRANLRPRAVLRGEREGRRGAIQRASQRQGLRRQGAGRSTSERYQSRRCVGCRSPRPLVRLHAGRAAADDCARERRLAGLRLSAPGGISRTDATMARVASSPETLAAGARRRQHVPRARSTRAMSTSLTGTSRSASRASRFEIRAEAKLGYDDKSQTSGKDVYRAARSRTHRTTGARPRNSVASGWPTRTLDARGEHLAARLAAIGHPRASNTSTRALARAGGAAATATSSSSTTTTSRSPTRTASRSNARTSSPSTRWPGQKAKGLRGRAAADPRTWSLFRISRQQGRIEARSRTARDLRQ